MSSRKDKRIKHTQQKRCIWPTNTTPVTESHRQETGTQKEISVKWSARTSQSQISSTRQPSTQRVLRPNLCPCYQIRKPTNIFKHRSQQRFWIYPFRLFQRLSIRRPRRRGIHKTPEGIHTKKRRRRKWASMVTKPQPVWITPSWRMLEPKTSLCNKASRIHTMHQRTLLIPSKNLQQNNQLRRTQSTTMLRWWYTTRHQWSHRKQANL